MLKSSTPSADGSQKNAWRIDQVVRDIESSGLRRAEVTFDVLKLINPAIYKDASAEEKEKFQTVLGNLKKQSVKKYVVRLKDMSPPVEPGAGTSKELVELPNADKLPDLTGLTISDGSKKNKTPPRSSSNGVPAFAQPLSPPPFAAPFASPAASIASLKGHLVAAAADDDSSLASDNEEALPGSEMSPFIVPANLQCPERQSIRGLEIKMVEKVKKNGLNSHAIHTRLEVAPPDMMQWHCRMTKGKFNMYEIFGPSQSFYQRQGDDYDHNQTSINEAINETIQAVQDPMSNRNLVYYKIVLPPEFVLDNRILSGDELYVEPDHHPMGCDDEETGMVCVGAFVSWTIAIFGTGTRFDNKEKKKSAKEIFQKMKKKSVNMTNSP